MMLPKLGDELIDLQHSYFETLLNSYEDIFKAELTIPGKKLVITRLLENLIEYSHIHFATEELQMRDQGYPYLTQHIEEHLLFLHMLEDFAKYIDKLNIDSIAEFTRWWFIQHVIGVDKHYIVWEDDDCSLQEYTSKQHSMLKSFRHSSHC